MPNWLGPLFKSEIECRRSSQRQLGPQRDPPYEARKAISLLFRMNLLPTNLVEALWRHAQLGHFRPTAWWSSFDCLGGVLRWGATVAYGPSTLQDMREESDGHEIH